MKDHGVQWQRLVYAVESRTSCVEALFLYTIAEQQDTPPKANKDVHIQTIIAVLSTLSRYPGHHMKLTPNEVATLCALAFSYKMAWRTYNMAGRKDHESVH